MKESNALGKLHAPALAGIAEPFRGRLLSMYNEEPQTGLDGVQYPVDFKSRVKSEQGVWLYELCLQTKASKTLEIGLASGHSTVFFLAAIAANGGGHHTAVDPYQAEWHGIGAAHAEGFGMQDSFTWMEQMSTHALVHLAERGESFGVIFIDGGHRYDEVLIDFTLAAPLCPVGGYIVLDDLWMPAIQSVVWFIRRNRKDFEEVRTSIANISVFRRVGEDDRAWDHFEPQKPWDRIALKLGALGLLGRK